MMARTGHSCLMAALLAIAVHTARAAVGEESEILARILSSTRFDPKVRPPGSNGTDQPVVVKVNLLVREIIQIDEKDMDITLQLTFREQWVDDRLRYDDMVGSKSKYVTLTDVSLAWQPDLFFANERSGHVHDLMIPNVFMRIFPDGSVLYSARVTMVLSCPMDFRRFPLDTQTCQIRMASYGFTNDHLKFEWKEGDPVQIVKNRATRIYSLGLFIVGDCTSRTNTGAYSCLKVDLQLSRDSRPWLLRAYLPSALLVVVSWSAFWSASRLHRAIIVAATFVATAAVTCPPLEYLPQLSYATAMHLWRDSCLGFIGAAMLQVMVVSYLSHYERCRMQGRPQPEGHTQLSPQDEAQGENDAGSFAMKPLAAAEDGKGARPQTGAGWLTEWLGSARLGGRLDVVARFSFPAAFTLFNLAYWASVLN